jgi:hypothetical protein
VGLLMPGRFTTLNKSVSKKQSAERGTSSRKHVLGFTRSGVRSRL